MAEIYTRRTIYKNKLPINPVEIFKDGNFLGIINDQGSLQKIEKEGSHLLTRVKSKDYTITVSQETAEKKAEPKISSHFNQSGINDGWVVENASILCRESDFSSLSDAINQQRQIGLTRISCLIYPIRTTDRTPKKVQFAYEDKHGNFIMVSQSVQHQKN